MPKERTNGGAVLVIDDEDSMREGCRQTLEDKGYRASVAENGEEGLLLAEKIRPNVALVDLKMPGMSGIDVLTGIREIDPDIASIVITGYGTMESAVEAMKLGACDFLCKPFDDEVLLESVSRVMEKKGIQGARAMPDQKETETEDQLAASVCHQLRPPAFAASQLIELVMHELRDPLTPRQTSILESACERMTTLRNMIEDWLEIGGIEGRPFTPDPEPMDLAQIIKDAWEMVPDEDAGARVMLRVETSDGVRPVQGKRRLLCGLFANLFSNSVKFTSGPGEIKVQVGMQDGNTIARISDTGVGIPAEELPHVFQPFYRGARAGVKRKGGSGLGLAVARTIVGVHRGNISVNSPPGQGATFTITLPAEGKITAIPAAPPRHLPAVGPARMRMITAKALSARQFSDFVNRLVVSQAVVGVKAKDGAADCFVFGPLNDASELCLDYDVTLLPPKKYLLPCRETLVDFKLGDAVDAKPHVEEPCPTVLIGIHPYDMIAINQLDRMMSEGTPDPHYLARREALAIIGADPTCVSESAFWTLMGCDYVKEGFDLWISDIGGTYVVESCTERGDSLLEKYAEARDATKEELIIRARRRKIIINKAPRRDDDFDPKDLPNLLRRSFDHYIWEENAKNCLSCGNCNVLCPTCYCFDVKDEVDISLTRGERYRTWDGCVLQDFAKIGTGENFRERRMERYRHRFYRKGMYLYDKCGHIACVGCGRCVSACLPDIADPVKVFNILKEKGS
jgi:sulfhydrogenase subunit beta (sulfur reductase)